MTTTYIRSILNTGYEVLGRRYLQGVDETETANERGAVDYLKAWIRAEFKYFSQLFNIQFVEENPYDNYDQLVYDMKFNGRLKVFNGGSESELLGDNCNLLFRAIHDCHHYFSGHSFETWEGEVMAFSYAIDRLPATDIETFEDARDILLSEIVLQASAYYVLNQFPDTQKVVFL